MRGETYWQMKRNRHKSLLAIGMLVSASLVATSDHSSARLAKGSRPVTMTGATTLAAQFSGSLLVTFPRKVDSQGMRVKHSGSGRVHGFIMKRVAENESDQEGILWSVVTERCQDRGCDGEQSPTFTSALDTGRYLSGSWRVYLIADAAPMAVTLEFAELPGRSTFRPIDPFLSQVVTLDRVNSSPGDAVYSTGGFTTLEKPSLGMSWLWLDGEPFTGSVFGNCVYRNRPSDSSTAFLPPCPEGEGTTEVSAQGNLVYATTAFNAKGLGTWFASPSPGKVFGSVALWMSFP